MFKVNKATEYAILLLISLDFGKDNLRPLAEIARHKNLPIKFLEKIAKKLKKSGIIVSKEGSGGGYFLAKKENEISINEIIHSVQGKKGMVSCIHGKCGLENTCLHKKVWLNLQEKLEKELEDIKLADLVK